MYNFIEDMVRKVNQYGARHGRHYLKDGKRWCDWAGCTFVWNPAVDAWEWPKEDQ